MARLISECVPTRWTLFSHSPTGCRTRDSSNRGRAGMGRSTVRRKVTETRREASPLLIFSVTSTHRFFDASTLLFPRAPSRPHARAPSPAFTLNFPSADGYTERRPFRFEETIRSRDPHRMRRHSVIPATFSFFRIQGGRSIPPSTHVSTLETRPSYLDDA